MALALPSLMVDRIAGISTVRLLTLLAVWGIAVFLWGTFGAWSQQQYLDRERALATPYATSLSVWLSQRTGNLNRLAADERLADGLLMPAGVESLPIQRVLYEYAYLNRTPEVYALDLLRGKSTQTAGAAKLPEEAVARLGRLPHGADLMVMALGQNNGQILFLQQAKAPLPQRLMVGVPQSLAHLAASMPAVPDNLRSHGVMLLLPHPQGWARWDNGSYRFAFPESLQSALANKTHLVEDGTNQILLIPLKGLPGVLLGIEGPRTIVSPALLPRLLVLVWAIAMSLLILWQEERLRTALGMATKPLAPLVGRLAPVTTMTRDMSAKLSQFGTILPLESIARAWREATGNAPLTFGPGSLDKNDFRNALPKRTLTNTPRKPILVAPTGAHIAAQAAGGALNKVDRRKRGRGSNVMAPETALPHMATSKPVWNTDQRESPKKEESPVRPETGQPPLDEEDLLEVVRDCLRHKRIKLLYQPVFRASDNIPVMHEVYARLIRRNGKDMTPAEFLPVTLRHRLTLELDLTVLRKVVHEHFSHGGAPLTPLAVNISSTSLDGIAYLQEMNSLGPRILRNLGFEVRSQDMIRDPKALKLLKEIPKHGGNLAVDYFGGGTAMLDASKAMGFNYVKLDSSRFMDTDEGKKNLIKLCQHANMIGLPVILEKIGHRETEDFARRVGAQFLQGYALQSPNETLTTTPLILETSSVSHVAQRPLAEGEEP